MIASGVMPAPSLRSTSSTGNPRSADHGLAAHDLRVDLDALVRHGAAPGIHRHHSTIDGKVQDDAARKPVKVMVDSAKVAAEKARRWERVTGRNSEGPFPLKPDPAPAS